MPYRDMDAYSCANDDTCPPPSAYEDELALARALPFGCAVGCGLWVVVGLSLYWLFH